MHSTVLKPCPMQQNGVGQNENIILLCIARCTRPLLGVKGYKLLDLISNNTFISRDVSFHEYIFLYTLSDLSSSPTQPFHFPFPPLYTDPLWFPTSTPTPSTYISTPPIPSSTSISAPPTPSSLPINISSPFAPESTTDPPPCRSPRICQLPVHLKDYMCQQVIADASSPSVSKVSFCLLCSFFLTPFSFLQTFIILSEKLSLHLFSKLPNHPLTPKLLSLMIGN